MIGEGGMGKVYKAIQIALDKPVVLKVLRQALLSDERTVARFQREAKAASRLNHPNSISVLDFGQADDGAMYIAMEYVQGKDLHHILSREWPLPEARVIRLMSQVLSALADAHSAGVIHRDLEAREHHGGAAPRRSRLRQGARLRHREDRRRHQRRRPGAHPGGLRVRHARVHVARAGARRAARSPQRSLRGRRDPLPADQRHAALRLRLGGRLRHQAPHRGAAAARPSAAPTPASRRRWSA